MHYVFARRLMRGREYIRCCRFPIRLPMHCLGVCLGAARNDDALKEKYLFLIPRNALRSVILYFASSM